VAKGRRDIKDEQLFARLIGAAVLLALAVIVLPFVLDGSGSQSVYEYAETLPSEPLRPEVPVPEAESSYSSRQAPIETKRAPAREEVRVSLSDPTPTTDFQSGSLSAGGNEPAVSVEQLASNVAAAASDGRPSASLSASPGGSLETISLQPGWNIQVASFVRDSNAERLLGRLRGQNLPAYANAVQGSTRTVFRVLVGPFANQIDALALQNRIDTDYRVESLIVRQR